MKCIELLKTKECGASYFVTWADGLHSVHIVYTGGGGHHSVTKSGRTIDENRPVSLVFHSQTTVCDVVECRHVYSNQVKLPLIKTSDNRTIITISLI